jgi:hypothetical protein
VRALTPEEPLIPTAARFNITHTNKGLRTHSNFRGLTLQSWATWSYQTIKSRES